MASNNGRPSPIADIFGGLWSILQGMRVTIVNFFRPKITVQYPTERLTPAPRFRGVMVHLRHEAGRLKCTACGACVRACPSEVITVEGDEGRGRDKRARRYDMDLSRCMFCNLCVEACPFDAIVLGPRWDACAYTREETVLSLEQLLEPVSPEMQRKAEEAERAARRRRPR